MFEIVSPKNRGQVVNLLVRDNAREISQAFDYNTAHSTTVDRASIIFF